MDSDTLARRLGTTAHVSPLLAKARKLGLRTPADLEKLAIQRGCRYYDLNGDSAVVREEGSKYGAGGIDNEFSNEELAVALLSICLPYSMHRLRLGAAMLAAENCSSQVIAQLARQERGETVVRYVALCGQKVEPDNLFWKELLALLPDVPMPLPDVLPHITRFVAMTGITRKGKETVMQWIRPTRVQAA